eukprot:gb/GFBE01073165.1/.p1 GENE.gb/GFBE01073165.1/~~gb/GFBE01073165.1/.p1  ORF type:complete len:288 (+),score=51.53 gb/GFBE01073165.1/:1-864(+)
MSLTEREIELEVPPQRVGRSDGADSGLRQRSHAVPSSPAIDEVSGLPRVLQEAPTLDERKLSIVLALLSIIDIISSGTMACVAFTYAYRAVGASLYCVGMQTISHLLSSILLTLRMIGEFTLGNDAEEGLLRQSRRKFLLREQGLSVAMGLSMLISAAAMVFKAFRKIRFWDKWYKDHENMDLEAQWATEFLAWYGFSFYVIQAAVRWYFGRKLRRSIIWHAFATSVISLVFLLVSGLAASYEKEWSWKAEPICAIVLAFVNLGEGVRIVICHLDDMDTRMRFDARA